jgi:hypothetical protein
MCLTPYAADDVRAVIERDVPELPEVAPVCVALGVNEIPPGRHDEAGRVADEHDAAVGLHGRGAVAFDVERAAGFERVGVHVARQRDAVPVVGAVAVLMFCVARGVDRRHRRHEQLDEHLAAGDGEEGLRDRRV